MKLIRRIGLFLVLSGVMLGVGGYTALKAEQFFYPNRYQVKETRNYEKEQVQQNFASDDQQPQVIEAAVENIPVVTADTTYLVEKVDLISGTVNETEESIPLKYIGLDREELIQELEAYDNNPPLTELEQGFETIELTAFSKDRVAICKYYKLEKDTGYYLMVADHFIVVYREDKQTLYMNTDILLESLSETLQTEIMQGKYVETEEELYNFLESYSS
ncbi:MAG: hypothetical protein K2J99_16545 [Lachnospiraceae bacterium]|nr:hypothetical protein [Lachnospiraceae bacterium]